MSRSKINRREFHQLTMAALGGLVAGSALAEEQETEGEEHPLLSEPHVCCGLNTCKGLGAAGDNECAGMGTCASAEHHSCNGQNDCAGQGGCGAPGENSCKGEGSCAVPIEGGMWRTARKKFERAMREAGKKFGDAPASCGK